MPSFSIPGLSVSLDCYRWGYMSGHQYGIRNEATTDYGVLYREVTGTIQRKMTIHFATADAPMEQLRQLAIRAGREALPVIFTDIDGSRWMVDWEANDFRQALDNRREVEIPLLEQQGTVAPVIPPAQPTVLIFDDDAGVTRYSGSGVFIAQDLKGDGTGAIHSAALRPSDNRYAFLQGGRYSSGELYCYNADGSLAWHVQAFPLGGMGGGTVQGGGNCLAFAAGKFFVGYSHNAGTLSQIPRINAYSAETGALVGTWDIPSPEGPSDTRTMYGFAVAPGGTLAYWDNSRPDWVMLSFDLASHVESVFVNATISSDRDFNALTCFANGDVLAHSWENGHPTQKLVRYSSSGVQQAIVGFTGNYGGMCVASDQNGVWVTDYDNVGTPHVHLYSLMGTLIVSFDIPEVDGPIAILAVQS